MCINIIESKDTKVLSVLNRDVQVLHTDIEPEIFQPYAASGIAQLFEELFRKNPDAQAYIAYYDGVPAGYVLFTIRHNPPTLFKKAYWVVYIDQMCVSKTYRGKGVGKQLIEKVKGFAGEHGIHRLELDCWTKNKQGSQYFEAQGFHTFNSRKYMII